MYKKEFLKIFKVLNKQWHSYDIWTDFIKMSACSISNAVDKSHFDEREKIYLQTIKKYKKNEQDLFPELLANLVLGLEENPEQDFLGEIYMDLGLNSKEYMQIFTPYYIAHMMAEITLNDSQEQIEEKGFITLHDSCCGSGVMLIASANVIKNRLIKANKNFQNFILVTGQDIDYIAVMMSYIQISLLGVAGYFKVGNSLTEPMTNNDSFDNYWFTPMYFSNVWSLRRLNGMKKSSNDK